MALEKGVDCDTVTTHGDYSKIVLINAALYRDVYLDVYYEKEIIK
jgi:hypothetical protein